MSTLGGIATLGRTIWRTYRGHGLRRRAVHELRRSIGGFRRAPRAGVQQILPAEADGVYAPRGSFGGLTEEDRARILDRGQHVLSGSYESFGHMWRAFPGTPKDWRSSITGSYVFPDGPWWTVPHLPAQADIKEVWEPARFGWVYDLIRAYQLSKDPAIIDAFNRRFDDWMRSSPPFEGVHWSCGQETAIRALALLHVEGALISPSGSKDAALKIAKVLAWSGERIEDAIGYGLSQRNNHGISESAGLVHLGLRFRGGNDRAATWLRTGLRLLDEQIKDQFLEDGWYAQHSFYYMRVAMEQALMAQRALERAGMSLAPISVARLGAAVDLLTEVIDGETGIVPNFGANDGSRILPLSSAEYRDFRPVLTLAALVLRRPLPSDIPADPEVLAWVGAPGPSQAPKRVDGVRVGSGSGWVVARHQGTAVFLRAGSFRHRPSHLDLLHVDVRVNGQELVVDPGSFAYNKPAPWKNGLAVARVHNAPVLDDKEPAAMGPRFLWTNWPSGRVASVEARSDGIVLSVEVPDRLRRDIVLRRSRVVVTDTVLDPKVRTAQVVWLLNPELAEAEVVIAEGASDIRPQPDAVDGWFSPSYLQRLPTRAICVRRDRSATQPLLIQTSIAMPATTSESSA